MMKKLVAFLFFISLAMVAAAVILPGFVNWNEHRDLVILQIEKRINRPVEIDGDIKIAVLPKPHIYLQNIVIKDEGKKNPLVRIRTLEVEAALGPLLEGRVEFDKLNVVAPEFYASEQGWKDLLIGQSLTSSLSGTVHIKSFTIKDGLMTGRWGRVENINLDIDAGSLAGPFRVTGDIVYRNTPSAVEMDIGIFSAKEPLSVLFSLLPVENLPQVKFKGVIDHGQIAGNLDISLGTISSLLGYDEKGALFHFLTQPCNLSANLKTDDSGFYLDDIRAAFDKTGKIAGRLSFIGFPGQRPLIKADLTAENLTLSEDVAWPKTSPDFDADISLSGKNIHLFGVKAADFTSDLIINQVEWIITTASAVLEDKSDFRIEGVITPEQKTAKLDADINIQDFAAMTGKIDIQSDALVFMPDMMTLKKFSIPDFSPFLDALKKSPDDLGKMALSALQKSETSYKNIDNKITISSNGLSFDQLALSDTNADIVLSGNYDLSSAIFSASLAVQPKSKIPAFTLELPEGKIDEKPFREYILARNPPPPPPLPEPVATPSRTIGDIIETLKTEDLPPETPHVELPYGMPPQPMQDLPVVEVDTPPSVVSPPEENPVDIFPVE